MANSNRCWSQTSWVQILAPPLTSCSKFSHLPAIQILVLSLSDCITLENSFSLVWDSSSTWLIELLWGFKWVIYEKLTELPQLKNVSYSIIMIQSLHSVCTQFPHNLTSCISYLSILEIITQLHIISNDSYIVLHFVALAEFFVKLATSNEHLGSVHISLFL